ncbi:hypothetical protein [Niveispirillum cyanobacteriorum]|uniref:hypothetical protein n=1 Tax=Niveispirillum cyanobacteriorum TaxID=1612173 RepID=UPI00131A215A|nr:hypothetical protein [Niveispirillum cyanobacteriorum]GGE62895.1 hypothetical protein GCM10011317_20480 [Niveispirillum cyanobacteriorum]
MFVDAKKFKTLVDKSFLNLVINHDDDINLHFSYLNEGKYMDKNRLWSTLNEYIQSSLKYNSSPAQDNFLSHLRIEIHRYEEFGCQRQPYQSIINRIWEAMRTSKCKSLDEQDSWLKAIAAARAINLIRGCDELPNIRFIAVNRSIRFLRAQGYELYIQGREVHFKEGEEFKIVNEIDKNIKKIGGSLVIRHILQVLREKNKFDGSRYTPMREYGPLDAPRAPSLPIGYIINLAIKYIDKNSNSILNYLVEWEKICNLSTALCSILDVEPYVNLEDMNTAPHEMTRYIYDISLYDHLFKFKQWSPRHVVKMLSSIFCDVDEDWMKKKLGWTISDVISFANNMISISENDGDAKIINGKNIITGNINHNTWRRMRKHFSHESRSYVNSGYLYPSDGDKSNWQDKPLISIGNNRYFSMPACFVGLSIFEATSSAIRNLDYPSFDDKIIPRALEKFIFQEFLDRGYNPTVLGKKYKMFDPVNEKKIEGECDVVVEGEDYILFIEAKKKSLTKASTTGAVLPNLIDIAESMLHAQSQIAVHERVLRYNGFIEFCDGFKVQWKNRRIDRIALTLLDHGSTQDKNIVEKIYNIFSRSNIILDSNSEFDKKINKINDLCVKMSNEIIELEKLGLPQIEQRLERWFISAPLLIILLDTIGHPRNFSSYFKILRHLTFNTLDFYVELKLAEKMKLLGR